MLLRTALGMVGIKIRFCFIHSKRAGGTGRSKIVADGIFKSAWIADENVQKSADSSTREQVHEPTINNPKKGGGGGGSGTGWGRESWPEVESG